jgi:hypothetical protein
MGYPGSNRFIVSKARKLKLLGAYRGAEAELPEEIEMQPRALSSPELIGTSAIHDGEMKAELALPK